MVEPFQSTPQEISEDGLKLRSSILAQNCSNNSIHYNQSRSDTKSYWARVHPQIAARLLIGTWVAVEYPSIVEKSNPAVTSTRILETITLFVSCRCAKISRLFRPVIFPWKCHIASDMVHIQCSSSDKLVTRWTWLLPVGKLHIISYWFRTSTVPFPQRGGSHLWSARRSNSHNRGSCCQLSVCMDTIDSHVCLVWEQWEPTEILRLKLCAGTSTVWSLLRMRWRVSFLVPCFFYCN